RGTSDSTGGIYRRRQLDSGALELFSYNPHVESRAARTLPETRLYSSLLKIGSNTESGNEKKQDNPHLIWLDGPGHRRQTNRICTFDGHCAPPSNIGRNSRRLPAHISSGSGSCGAESTGGREPVHSRHH